MLSTELAELLPLKVHKLFGGSLVELGTTELVRVGQILHVQHIGEGMLTGQHVLYDTNFVSNRDIRCRLSRPSFLTLLCTGFVDEEGRIWQI